jgi:hypothetical protein
VRLGHQRRGAQTIRLLDAGDDYNRAAQLHDGRTCAGRLGRGFRPGQHGNPYLDMGYAIPPPAFPTVISKKFATLAERLQRERAILPPGTPWSTGGLVNVGSPRPAT